MTGKAPRSVVITCAVLETEIEHFSEGLPHLISIVKLPQGLHNDPPRLRRDLQALIDQVEGEVRPEAIILGYGLCSRGTEGVRTRNAVLVVPRAHDCITLLLGSKEKYTDYVEKHPGTYWYSPGWNRHHTPPGEKRYLTLLRQYEEQYGEDNGRYLMDLEQHWFRSYDRATYVDCGIGATAEDLDFTHECAEWLGWQFDRQEGSPQLIRDLLSGNWDPERFLVLKPGETLRLTADGRIMEAVESGAN